MEEHFGITRLVFFKVPERRMVEKMGTEEERVLGTSNGFLLQMVALLLL